MAQELTGREKVVGIGLTKVVMTLRAVINAFEAGAEWQRSSPAGSVHTSQSADDGSSSSSETSWYTPLECPLDDLKGRLKVMEDYLRHQRQWLPLPAYLTALHSERYAEFWAIQGAFSERFDFRDVSLAMGQLETRFQDYQDGMDKPRNNPAVKSDSEGAVTPVRAGELKPNSMRNAPTTNQRQDRRVPSSIYSRILRGDYSR